MGKFIAAREARDEQLTLDIHVNADSILYLQVGKQGTIGKTDIFVLGGGRRVRVHDDMQQLLSQLAPVLGAPARLTPVTLAANVPVADLYVFPGQVLEVVEASPRPANGRESVIWFNDGHSIKVEDAVALLELL